MFFIRRISIPLILIAVPIILGLWARYQAVPFWESHKEEFYIKGRPIFTAYDAYYFARLADDYNLGVFHPGGIDKLRFVPDYADYPDVIPLYSWIFAKLSALTGKPVENLAFWFIPILAVLIAIPITIFLLKIDAPLAALGGALAASLSLIYVVRTSINRLDTDSIVLFSFFSIPLAVLLVYLAPNRRQKYLYLLLVAVFSLTFYWGYLHPDLNLLLWLFSILFLSYPLLKEWFLKGRKEGKSLKDSLKGKISKDLLLLTLAFNPVILLFGVFSLVKQLWVYVIHFNKPLYGNFPNVQVSISELQKLDFSRLAKLTVGNETLLILSLIGVALFIFFRFRFFLLLLPTFLIGLLAFKGASRFAMFLVPVLGIGFGFLFDLLMDFVKRRYNPGKWVKASFYSLLGLLLIGTITFSDRLSFKFIPQPIMTSDLADAFIELGKQTPPNAWIYTWWDYGYAIQYYARRATFHDGGSQLSPKTYFVALGFTTSSPLAAYNITKTLTICGKKCIKKLLEEGKTAQQIKEMFVKGTLLKGKKVNHPVYWVFTQDLIGKFYWISYFGSWNFKTLKGTHHPIYGAVCVPQSVRYYICNIGGKPALFDTWNLLLVLGRNRAIPVKYFAIRTPQKLEIEKNRDYPYGEALEKVYTYKRDIYAWFLTDMGGFKTNFNQMYILRNWDEKYFKKTKEKFPNYLFLKVR